MFVPLSLTTKGVRTTGWEPLFYHDVNDMFTYSHPKEFTLFDSFPNAFNSNLLSAKKKNLLIIIKNCYYSYLLKSVQIENVKGKHSK